MTEKRIAYLDTARVICMLWIIAIWHMGAYMPEGTIFVPYNDYTNCITVGVLAAFTFISGYFLGKAKISGLRDTLSFYKKRFIRFWPLFCISCVSIYIASEIFHIEGISSAEQLIHVLTGVSCFCGDMPFTVWYFSMLVLFYIITPLINICRKLYLKIFLSGCLYFVMYILCYYCNADKRIIMYFPFYCLGLIVANRYIIDLKCNCVILILSILSSIVLITANVRFSGLLMCYLSALSVMIAVIEVSKLLTTCKTEYFFKMMSYLSMCAYLFHRQFLGAMQVIFGNFTYVEAYVVFLPMLLVVSFVIQKVYDLLIVHMV